MCVHVPWRQENKQKQVYSEQALLHADYTKPDCYVFIPGAIGWQTESYIEWRARGDPSKNNGHPRSFQVVYITVYFSNE